MKVDVLDIELLGAVALWFSAIAGIIVFIIVIWRVNISANEFRAVDLILEGDPPKASVNKLILVVFALLSVWVVVVSVLDKKIDPGVAQLLLGVLGIFVLGRVGAQAVATMSKRAPQTDPEDPEPSQRPVVKPKSTILK